MCQLCNRVVRHNKTRRRFETQEVNKKKSGKKTGDQKKQSNVSIKMSFTFYDLTGALVLWLFSVVVSVVDKHFIMYWLSGARMKARIGVVHDTGIHKMVNGYLPARCL